MKKYRIKERVLNVPLLAEIAEASRMIEPVNEYLLRIVAQRLDNYRYEEPVIDVHNSCVLFSNKNSHKTAHLISNRFIVEEEKIKKRKSTFRYFEVVNKMS